MPRRIIINAGFHRAGTSSIQACLRENRAKLKKQMALRLRWHMKDVLFAARRYSVDLDPLTLVTLQSRFGTMINTVPKMPRRTLVLCAEELCGHLPGRDGVNDYGTAPVMLYAYWEIIRARYPEAEVIIFLNTRAPEAWLTSAYWEHVVSSDMKLDFDAFCEAYEGAADLQAMAAEIASRVPTPVLCSALEASVGLPLGPADPLLDLCDIPAALRPKLRPVAVANERQGPDVLAALLAVNRTQKNNDARNAAKKAILAEASVV